MNSKHDLDKVQAAAVRFHTNPTKLHAEALKVLVEEWAQVPSDPEWVEHDPLVHRYLRYSLWHDRKLVAEIYTSAFVPGEFKLFFLRGKTDAVFQRRYQRFCSMEAAKSFAEGKFLQDVLLDSLSKRW